MRPSLALSLAGLTSLAAAGTYVLEDDYEPASFLGMFDFFTGADPTNGYVNYVGSATAQANGLVSTANGQVYLGVDHTSVPSSPGRSSVRLSSRKSYMHGLVILDLAHMPGGICGTWPAFWLLGPNWPNGGEVDIIEGVNSQSYNKMTLHTSAGCSISTQNNLFTGSITTPNCDTNAPGQGTNAGCSIEAPSGATFGTAFNQNGGGVYATEWTSSFIRVFFFPHGQVPADIGGGSPNPSGWGEPVASFEGGCNIDAFFQPQQIMFDTTFCGDWAGDSWTSDPVCSSLASTCQAYVQNNPSAFAGAYWMVNSLKVYTATGSTGPTVASSANPTSTAFSSTVSSASSISSASSFSTSSVTSATASLPTTIPTSFTTSIRTGYTKTTSSAPLEGTIYLSALTAASLLPATTLPTYAIPFTTSASVTATPAFTYPVPSTFVTPHPGVVSATPAFTYPVPSTFVTLYPGVVSATPPQWTDTHFTPAFGAPPSTVQPPAQQSYGVRTRPDEYQNNNGAVRTYPW